MFFFFVLRKFYLATLLLTMENRPTIQLCMCSFSHFVAIVGIKKYKIFKLKRDNFRIILSEALIFIGVGTSYFLLDDQSEDESYRLKYSWIILVCLLSSLMIHAFFFVFFEILFPVAQYIYKLFVKEENKVHQLREMRNKVHNIDSKVDQNNLPAIDVKKIDNDMDLDGK